MDVPNIKVKREAFAVAGVMYLHLGPAIKALFLSLNKKMTVREELEKLFQNMHYDSSIDSTVWPKRSLAEATAASVRNKAASFSVPKSDIFAHIKSETIKRLVSARFHRLKTLHIVR
jgi:hypothetical protein